MHLDISRGIHESWSWQPNHLAISGYKISCIQVRFFFPTKSCCTTSSLAIRKSHLQDLPVFSSGISSKSTRSQVVDANHKLEVGSFAHGQFEKKGCQNSKQLMYLGRWMLDTYLSWQMYLYINLYILRTLSFTFCIYHPKTTCFQNKSCLPGFRIHWSYQNRPDLGVMMNYQPEL